LLLDYFKSDSDEVIQRLCASCGNDPAVVEAATNVVMEHDQLCDFVKASVMFENWRRDMGEAEVAGRAAGAAERSAGDALVGEKAVMWQQLRARTARVDAEKRRGALEGGANLCVDGLNKVLVREGGWMRGFEDADELRSRVVPVSVFKMLGVLHGMGEWEMSVGNAQRGREWMKMAVRVSTVVADEKFWVLETMNSGEKRKTVEKICESQVKLLECGVV